MGRGNGIAGFAETLRSVGEVIAGRRPECGRSTTWRQSMPPRTTRTAAALAAIVAAGLAAFAFRPTAAINATAHNPAEIRTVTIRRTIHVVRHVPGPGRLGSSGARGRVVAAKRAAVSTHASGSHKRRCDSSGGDGGDARQRVTWSRSWRFVRERRRSHDSCQWLARRWFYQWLAGGHPRRDPRERVPQRRSCDFGQPGYNACQWWRPHRGGWRRRWQRRRQLDGGGQPDRTGSRWRC